MKNDKLILTLFLAAALNIGFIYNANAAKIDGVGSKTTNLSSDATVGVNTQNMTSGDTILNGNGYAINGAGYTGNSSTGAWLRSTNNLAGKGYENKILNVGSFNLNSTVADGDITIIKLDSLNNAVRYAIKTVNNGAYNFKSTGSQGGSFIYSTDNLAIENSVIKGNENTSSKSGAKGGAIYLGHNTQDNPGIKDGKNYAGKFEIKNSLITDNLRDALTTTYAAEGGAVYSQQKNGILTVSDSYFVNNKAKANTASTSTYAQARGGAIFNSLGALDIDGAYFGGNQAVGSKAYGGAIYADSYTPEIENAYFKHTIDKTVFENNSATGTVSSAYAGAIYSANDTIIKDSLFLSNKVVLNPELLSTSNIMAYGGAINQNNNTTGVVSTNPNIKKEALLDISKTVFKDNSVEFKDSSIDITKTATAEGGAIRMSNSSTKIHNGVLFQGNSVINENTKTDVVSSGGAIAIAANTLGKSKHDITATFNENKVISEGTARGGAIAGVDATSTSNIVTTNIDNSVLTNNLAQSNSKTDTGAKGGAIYAGTLNFVNLNNSVVDSNKSISAASGNVKYGGGAAYVADRAILTAVDTSFTNNVAIGESASGGAIYNEKGGTVNIIAKEKNIVFNANKAGANQNSLSSNAIHSAGGTVNLNAAAGKEIIFNDAITSTNNSTLNINKKGTWNKEDWPYTNRIPNDAPYGEGTGAIVLNANMDNFLGDINVEGGTVRLGAKGTFFNNAKSFNVLAPSYLDVANGVTQSHNFNNFKLDAPLDVALDIDPLNSAMDSFYVTNATVGENGKINIKNIHIMNDIKAGNEVSMYIGDIGENEELMDIITLDESVTTALGDIYKFDMEYDSENATLTMKKQGGGSSGNTPAYTNFNPAIMVGSVASQAAYLTQLNSYDMAFQNILAKMMMPKMERRAETMRNRFAIKDSNEIHYNEDGSHTWFKPYTSIEKVNLKNGPDVDNIMYGTFIGNDGKVRELKNGKRTQLSSYLAYNGSRQSFDGNKIYQNGGLFGFTGAFYRDNFYAALTANAGATVAMASTMFGDDTIPIFTTGTAMQSGYNFEFAEGKFILQPNVLLSYSFINTFDFTNARDLKIDSNPMHAMQVAPGFRIFGHTKSGWQPYISTAMKWNFIDDPSFSAANVALPELSVKPYVEYGIGLQKNSGDNFFGYLQTLIRNGGRTGVAFSAGLDILMGKNKKPKNIEQVENQMIDVKVEKPAKLPKTDKKVKKDSKKNVKQNTNKNVKKKADKKVKTKKNWGYYKDPYIRNIK